MKNKRRLLSAKTLPEKEHQPVEDFITEASTEHPETPGHSQVSVLCLDGFCLNEWVTTFTSYYQLVTVTTQSSALHSVLHPSCTALYCVQRKPGRPNRPLTIMHPAPATSSTFLPPTPHHLHKRRTQRKGQLKLLFSSFGCQPFILIGKV